VSGINSEAGLPSRPGTPELISFQTKIFYTARREFMYREIGAMIDPERLACNLLSSAPLVFNLFAPLAQELFHASSALNELFPIGTADARRLLFEQPW
jgi:hypothetical protein